MKTSNIILISFIVLILVLLTVGIFSAKNTLQGFIEDYKTEAEVVSIETDTTYLADYDEIEIYGDGHVKIVQSPKNYLTATSLARHEIKNGCLYINPNHDIVVLNIENLHRLSVKEDATAEAQSFVTDTLELHLSGDASTRLYSFSVAYAEITAEGDTEIEIEESLINAGKIILHNDAQIFLINTPVNDLDFEQNDDSELKFRGKSKVGSK